MAPRRDIIRREAARLFAVRGYGGASLRDIAAASGVRQPTLYDHYDSKAAILLEVVHGYFDELAPRLREAGTAEGTAAARLAAMLRAAGEVGFEHRDAFLATSNNWELIRTDPELTALVGRRDEVQGLWQAVLTTGFGDGSIRKVKLASALSIIASSVAGLVDLRYHEPTETGPPDIDTLVSVLVEGLAPRPIDR